MHITVYCPRCRSRYQLKPELRGQRMRCPNAICREIFEVREEADTSTPAGRDAVESPKEESVEKSSRRTAAPAEAKFVAGNVGEMVPLLTVENAHEPPAAPATPSWQQAPPPVRRSSSVGDMVPLLPTEPAVEEKPAPPPEPLWQQAPPPIRRGKSSAPAPETAPAAESKALSGHDAPPPVPQPAPGEDLKPAAEPPHPKEALPESEPKAAPAVEVPSHSLDAPTELPPGAWEPPPVRRPVSDSPAAPPPEAPESSPAATWPAADSEPHAAPAKRRKALWIIVGMLLLLGAGIYWAVSSISGFVEKNEEELAQTAKEAYDNGNYPIAARDYKELQKHFPDSARLNEYAFWEDLSQARSQVKALDTEADVGLQQLRAFLRKHEADPLLKQYKADVWQAYLQLLDGKLVPATTPTVTQENLEQQQRSLAHVRAVHAELEQFADGQTFTSRERDERLEFWHQAILAEQSVKTFLADLTLEEKGPRALGASTVGILAVPLEPGPLLAGAALFPGRAGEKELNLDRLRDWQQLAQNRGLAVHSAVAARFLLLKARLKPEIYIAGGNPLIVPPSGDKATTLLIAPRLDRADDPLPPEPPTAVVLALVRGVLYALREDTGHVVWADRVGIDTATLPLRLPKGRDNPEELVLVLSSDSNTLMAREALTGKPRWVYHLGQPCLGQPVVVGLKAYIATVEGEVHEIEIVRGQVLGRYQLGARLSGTGARLEGTSLIYFPAEAGFVFVLDVDKRKCVAVLETGHPAGSLRGAPLLVAGDLVEARKPDGTIPPHYLILTQTDGLDAMKLRTYRLPAEKAVPLLPEPRVRGWSWFEPYCDGERIVLATDAGVLGMFGIRQAHNTDPLLFPLLPREYQVKGDDKQVGRAQVVHASENDYWVLALGQLQQYHCSLSGKNGLSVAAVWEKARALGSPLHAGQVSANQDTLFVVTQGAAQQGCLATAITAATGETRWQRQLGLDCKGELFRVGGRVLAFDQDGDLSVFDPKEKAPLLPRPVKKSPPTVWLLPASDDASAYALTVPSEDHLALRRLHPGTAPDDTSWDGFAGTLGGTPALGKDCVVMPLANGKLARLALKEKALPDGGPSWHSVEADAGALGHVAALGGSTFLYTDGSRGLHRIHWPTKEWDTQKPEDHVELANRIVAAPLVLPVGEKDRLHVFVADAANHVRLLDADTLQEKAAWALDGKITAGPFALGRRVGCVLDRRRLVCLEAGRDKKLWEYDVAAVEGIVGRPQTVGDVVVLADGAGQFVALDAENGQPCGPGYVLKAKAAPAASPVAFGADRVFAPLTDGTALLLTLEQLKKPAEGP